MDMRFELWNVRSLYREGPLMTVSRELSKYKLHLAGVQVRWEGGCTEPAGEYILFYGRGNFVSDRMSYIILRGRWCHIIVVNVHAPTGDKTDDVKDSFYKELG
jgi:hypothetical protein